MLTCRARGAPEVGFTWNRNGQVIGVSVYTPEAAAEDDEDGEDEEDSEKDDNGSGSKKKYEIVTTMIDR